MARIVITNGDHAATALSAHFPDAEILIWRDVLIEGPVPGGIDDEALADIRARHIEQSFGMPGVREDFTRRNVAFAKISAGDDIELWFETDLHDQLQLIELLSRFEDRSVRSLKLAMAPPPLPSNIDKAERALAPVSSSAIPAAWKFWTAFRAAEPGEMLVAASNESELPTVAQSFARLLEEFPGTHDGLGLIERSALLAVRDGAITPGLAFRHYQQTEALPFLGDLGFYHRLDALGFAATPLISRLPEGGIAQAVRTNHSVEYMHTPVELTEAGHAVLERRADFVALNGIDRWIGGVHLTRSNLWRYDSEKKSLARD